MNAIILAAGLGSRFNELTKENHKALLPIDGIPNIERTIRYLQEADITDITVITGHMASLFDYLKAKYGVTLIYNDKYKEYNNVYSFSKAVDKFGDTFMIDADVVLLQNVFLMKPDTSLYYVLQRPKSDDKEWCPRVENGKVVQMDITNEYVPSMLGISYWTKEDAIIIKDRLPYYMEEEKLQNAKLFWDNLPIDCLDKIIAHTKLLDEHFVDEMDTVENYQRVCEKVKALRLTTQEVC